MQVKGLIKGLEDNAVFKYLRSVVLDESTVLTLKILGPAGEWDRLEDREQAIGTVSGLEKIFEELGELTETLNEQKE